MVQKNKITKRNVNKACKTNVFGFKTQSIVLWIKKNEREREGGREQSKTKQI